MVSDTKKYYDKLKRTNPQKYRDTRLKQQLLYQKSGHGLALRIRANREDRASKANGTGKKGDNKDNSHVTDKNGKKKTVLAKQSTNRAGLGIHKRRKPRN